VGVIHFDNGRLRRLAGGEWLTEAYAVARADFAALAAWHAVQPEDRRPVAYHGVTLLAALTRRAGFEVRDRRPSLGTRIEDWYLRSILVRWSPIGRRRLDRGRGELRARDVWMSAGELLRRFAGSAAQ